VPWKLELAEGRQLNGGECGIKQHDTVQQDLVGTG
jgi:hypothetical protein